MSESTGGVEVLVQSQLQKVIEDLQNIQKAGASVGAQMKTMSGDIGKGIEGQNKEIEKGLEKTKNLGRRVADQLKKDFSSLFAVGSLTSGLKLADQFGGSIKESVNLSDTVRRLSSVFGIAGKDFIHFQNLMISGLGEIGAGSESAANALKGLAETPVRGEKNLLAYAKTAAQLASISGEKGQEGAIAKGAAGVITAQGGNVNDTKQLGSVTNEMLQIHNATGKGFAEVAGVLQELYSKTNKDFQGQLKGGGSTTLATAALSGGPQATAFLEKYLGMSRIERKGSEAQGLGQIVGANGQLNVAAISKTMDEAKSRGLGDAQAGLKTMGLGDEEAKGFIRLSEAMERSGTAINGAKDSVADINAEYRKTMSLGDSFRANINRVKSVFAPVISGVSQGLTSGMGATSQSGIGAVGVTGGAAILAAVLTGGGLRGIGGALSGGIGGEAKAKAIEAITGEHVQKVEVINFPAGGGLGGIAAKVGGAATTVGTGVVAAGAATVATAAATGTALVGGAYALSELTGAIVKALTGADLKNTVGMSGSAARNGFGDNPSTIKVSVETKTRDLRVTPLPGRGSSN